MRRLINTILFSLALAAAGTAAAEAVVSPRHLIILREGVDAVWGSYVFAVVNAGNEAAPLKAAIVLPKEAADWAPQEGIEPEAVKLAPGGGGLIVEKDFPPGTHVITIGFKVPASFGHAELTFTPAAAIGEMTVLSPRASKLTIDAPWLKPAANDASPDPDYHAFTADGPLAAGVQKDVRVAGIPEGRGRLWMLGGGVAALLVLGALALALKTRPRLSGDGQEAVLVG